MHLGDISNISRCHLGAAQARALLVGLLSDERMPQEDRPKIASLLADEWFHRD